MAPMTSHRLGLVIEGGGFRALYAAGVLDVLLELHLPVRGVIGVSAGAIHGVSFVSGQKERSLRIYTRFAKDDRLWSLWRWLKTGDLIDPKFCYGDIPDRLEVFDCEAFARSGIDFYSICSNVETGEPEYLRLSRWPDDMDGLRASASLPYVSPLIPFRGMKLLDGGCTDRVPLAAFESLGYDVNIVIETHPRGHRVKDRDAAAAKWWYRKYPKFVESFEKSGERYQETVRLIDRREKEGRVFSIRPHVPIPVKRLTRNLDDIRCAYEMGKADAERAAERLTIWAAQWSGASA